MGAVAPYIVNASAVGRLFAGPLMQLRDLRGERVPEVCGFEQRSYFDLARPGHGIGAALYPCDRLVHVLDFPEPEAGHQLACLGERPVDDCTVGAIEGNTLAVPRWFEAVAGAHNAGIDQLLIISAHRLEHLGR